jgi:hypothetical protein
MRVARSLLMAAGMAALVACAEPGVTERVQADHALGQTGTASLHADRTLAEQGVGATGSQVEADRRAAEQAAKPVLRRARTPWVGSVSVPMGSGERLPSIFTEPVKLNFDDAATGGKVSLRTMADRITAVTGVPVRLKAVVFVVGEVGPRPVAQQLAPQVPAAPSLPSLPARAPGGSEGVALPPLAVAAPRDTSVNAVAMRWSGSLEGYLDLITDQLSLSWQPRVDEPLTSHDHLDERSQPTCARVHGLSQYSDLKATPVSMVASVQSGDLRQEVV